MEFSFNQNNFTDKQIIDFLKINDNPTTISFISPNDESLISIPIWTIYQGGKFYLFTRWKSLKVKAINTGNHIFSLLVINKDAYPHPDKSIMSYLSISGDARIVTTNDMEGVAELEIKLLKKYNAPDKQKWLDDLIKKLEDEPENAWLIEINPNKIYTYDN